MLTTAVANVPNPKPYALGVSTKSMTIIGTDRLNTEKLHRTEKQNGFAFITDAIGAFGPCHRIHLTGKTSVLIIAQNVVV